LFCGVIITPFVDIPKNSELLARPCSSLNRYWKLNRWWHRIRIVSYEKPFWLSNKNEPKELNAEEEDAIMRRAAKQVFLPKRVRALEEKLAKLEEGKNHPKGFDGLKQKKRLFDLDRYDLTERQHDVMSLYVEYGVPKKQIALRLRLHPKTVYEHMKAAEKRMNQQYSNWRRRSKTTPTE
jgi:hypothetical protein